MPFRARNDDGDKVVPAMVSTGESVRCLRCAGKMYVRDPVDRVRHFYHHNANVGKSCPSSHLPESGVHARCTELAVEALQSTFVGRSDVEYGAEVQIDVRDGLSHHLYRQGDAVAIFQENHPTFGNGLVIEVQHKHEGKNIELTTHDYLSAGYSVLWLDSDEFTDTEFTGSIHNRFENGADGAFAACNGLNWVWDCESFQYTEEHAFREIPAAFLAGDESYEICASRPCSLRRQWDSDLEAYRYDPDDLPNVTVLFAALEGAISIDPNRRRDRWSKQDFRMKYGDAIVEKILANNGTVAPCRGPGGVHQWEIRESLSESYAHVGLHDCRHCRAILYVDRRGYPDEHTTIIFDQEPDPSWQLTSLDANPRHCDHPNHDEAAEAEGCPTCGLLI